MPAPARHAVLADFSMVHFGLPTAAGVAWLETPVSPQDTRNRKTMVGPFPLATFVDFKRMYVHNQNCSSIVAVLGNHGVVAIEITETGRADAATGKRTPVNCSWH